MDTKSFSREIAERIAGRKSPITAEDQERFITALLGDVRAHVGPSIHGERLLTFHDPFTSEYPEFFLDGRKRRAVFRAEERKDTELVEYFAFGHPIIEAIVERVLARSIRAATGLSGSPATRDLSPAHGWLFVYVITLRRPGRAAHASCPCLQTTEAVSVETGEALIGRA